jgi:D-sedoheptulose 7-phosphate isomerase
MNRVETIFQDSSSPEVFARGYLAYLGEVLGKMDTKAIAAFIEALLDAREKNKQIFFLGNGGSAATASHFANDVAIGSRTLHKPFRAIALTDNVAAMTAIANDYGYDDIFVQQLMVLSQPGDVVVAISASGNSPNVIKAVEYAKSKGALTVGLTGFDGGKLKQLCEISVHVPSNKGEYGPVEDLHMVVDHLLGAYLMLKCRK